MWLIPFKGRNHSGCYTQNFLWNENNVYIMDNHRAALWCWFQHISKDEKINFIHIDKHTDTLQSKIKEWVASCPDLWSIGIEDYLSLIHTRTMGHDIPLFRWDNYGSVFLEKYGGLIDSCIFATHNCGDDPNIRPVLRPDIWDVAGNLMYWMDDSDNKWVINLDLDYFFYESDPEDYSIMFSNIYIDQVFKSIKQLIDKNKVSSFTMCLSPECCGSWEAAEEICYRGTEILDIDFKLAR